MFVGDDADSTGCPAWLEDGGELLSKPHSLKLEMENTKLKPTVLMIATWLTVCASGYSESGLELKTTPEGVEVSENGTRVLFYQRATRSQGGNYPRANYVHPLYDLDGQVLTEDFPDDHPHQRGIFWAWHQLRVGERTIGDGWGLQDLAWKVHLLDPVPNEDGSVTLELAVDWVSPRWQSGKLPVVTEETAIRIFPREETRRRIDFDIKLRAATPETFLGGAEDEKGYGGFSARIRLPEDLRFSDQNGEVTPETNAVRPSPWMTMTGTFGESTPSGLTILCHPETPGYPQPWILRSARSMQNPVWPGRNAERLPVDTPVRLRYRLIVHSAAVSVDEVARWHREWIAETTGASISFLDGASRTQGLSR